MPEEIAISEVSRKIIEREQSHHRSRSVANAEKWGVQDLETLALAICEQSGKLSQSILHSTKEPDKCVAGRTLDEARHIGALSIQVAFAYLVDKSLAKKPAGINDVIKSELVACRDTLNLTALPEEQRQFVRGNVHALKFIQQQIDG